MALGSTQALTEMNVSNLLPRGKGRSARKADNLTAICEPTVYHVEKMWEPQRLTILCAFRAC
jgi:hypothetical protein